MSGQAISIEELKENILANIKDMDKNTARLYLWVMYLEAKEKRLEKYEKLCEKLDKILLEDFPFAEGDLREKVIFALTDWKKLERVKTYDESHYWYIDKSLAKIFFACAALSLVVGYFGGLVADVIRKDAMIPFVKAFENIRKNLRTPQKRRKT